MPIPRAIAAAIEAGDTVIASSARGARALRRLHAEAQRDQGREAWQAVDIIHWDGWLDRLWQRLLRSGNEPRMLLSTLQEQQVWARLVRPGIEGKHLISVLSVSDLAQSAYALLCDYEALDFLRGDLVISEEVDKFRAWAISFQQECRREAWLSHSNLPFALREAVDNHLLDAAARLVLVGFDRITPAQQRLVDAFPQTLLSDEFAEAVDASPPPLVKATDKKDEIATCALWVRSQLNASGGSARIAVVVPGVAALRTEIERIFREILAPETVSIGAGNVPVPFEFSLGVPLTQLPMVRAALLLLRWLHQGLPQDQASWLLLSGHICRDTREQLAVARFDARLRQKTMRPPHQDLDGFLQWLDKAWAETAPLGDLRTRLQAAQRLVPANSILDFAQWVQRTAQILDLLLWPGGFPLQSEDYQVLARWSDLQDMVAALAFDARRVDYATFLEVLEQQARKTVYAPESQDAPVQILGPFEAAGLTFDALWFLGAEDVGWPPAARPHPFLTRSVQRKHEMPHSHVDVDWKLAKHVTTRLTQSAGICVFSYAAQNAEGTCRPSSLVASGTVPLQAEAMRVTIGATDDLVTAHDFPAVRTEAESAVVLPWPADQIAGGAYILSNQAACPFRAFASRRLGAASMEAGDWGLDPRDRGSLVHNVLDRLWAELANREGLVLARSEGRLPSILIRHLDECLQKYRDEGLMREWNEAYLAAEHARILSILDDWLKYEETRAEFHVEAREEKRTASVGALKLQLRVDRIDQVKDGRVIIDYKTGVVKTNIWDGARPDDPQLPIYAAFGEVENVQGVLLGRVAEDRTELVGRVLNNDAVFQGKATLVKPPYSEAMLQEWKENLHRLAEQFLRGEAQVDPKQYPRTCQYCDLPGLCRVAESERAAREDDAGESEGEADA